MGLRPLPVPPESTVAYRFGEFTLDLGKGCLHSGADEVKLRPKPFEALRYIVERAGRLVSKDELTAAVWPDSFVSDNSLAQCFMEIRKALGDEGQRMIKTVARRGYLFSIPVEKVPAHMLQAIPPTVQPISPTLTPELVAAPARTPKLKWLGTLAGLLVILTAAGLWLFLHSRTPAPATPIVVLAVLPFQSLVQSEPDEFLELGIADALITRLSNVRQLVVRPTSAVRNYTDRKRDAVDIGKRLKVAFVVDGSVQQKADRIRVSVQLIGVPDGRPLWAERYDQPAGDIFAVQDAISTQLAAALAIKLTGDENSRLRKQPTSNEEAFQLYLRGRYFWERRTNEDLTKALQYFTEATHHDTRYALAYAGAAQCYAPLMLLGFRRMDDAAIREMRGFVNRAVQLDPNLADAYVAQASLRMFEWDWLAAESSFQRAIEINPNNPLAHLWYGWFLDAMGREQENLAERRRALALDPLSWLANAALAQALRKVGRHDEAIQLLQATVELNQNFFFTRQEFGNEYLARNRPDLAIAEFQVVQDLPSLGYAFALNGQKREAERILERMRANPLATSFDLAVVTAGLGRKSQALDLLERAYQQRILWLMFMRVDERLATLRENPRFEAIASKMRIPAPR